jgi:hypothetical protein
MPNPGVSLPAGKHLADDIQVGTTWGLAYQFAKVTVHLYQINGTQSILMGTTTTNMSGEYYFNASNVSGGISPDTTYEVRVDNPTDYQTGNPLYNRVPTTASSAISGSKGILRASTTVVAAVLTGEIGQNDHTIDFGFAATHENICTFSPTSNWLPTSV